MGTEKGKDVKEVIESDVQLYTSPIVIAEIYSKLKISLKVLCFRITVRRANVSVRRKSNLYKSSEILEYLMRLAFEMHKKNLKTFGVDDAIDVFKKCIPQKDDESSSDYKRRIDRRFNELEPNCGLLNLLSSGVQTFLSKSFKSFTKEILACMQ
jgi:hypothetical protein